MMGEGDGGVKNFLSLSSFYNFEPERRRGGIRINDVVAGYVPSTVSFQ